MGRSEIDRIGKDNDIKQRMNKMGQESYHQFTAMFGRHRNISCLTANGDESSEERGVVQIRPRGLDLSLVFSFVHYYTGTRYIFLRKEVSFQSYESLSLEHALLNLSHNIPPIMLPNKYNTPSSSPHSTRPSQSMNEIYRGMWYII